MISHVAVLVPARNEQDRIERCLRSLVVAKQQCTVHVSIILAADACRDATVQRALAFPEVQVLEVDFENVGAARRAAAQHALDNTLVAPESLWLANTDADSVVPQNWLSSQLALANAGYDLVVGTVRPDPAEYPVEMQREWLKTHVKGKPNGHVHGANLGVRASAYCEVGGYLPMPEHEDVDLVARLARYPKVASDAGEVITSARLEGRTPGGYAGYLKARADAASLIMASSPLCS